MKLLRETNYPGVFNFFCPGCNCYHSVYTETANSLGAKWSFNGNIEAPTFSPSLLIQYDLWIPPVTSENFDEWKREPWEQKPVRQVCHLFVTDGKIQFLGDCTHPLAGQTVPMQDEK